MRIIPLTGKNGRGRFVLVDDKDFFCLSQYGWFVSGGRAGKEYVSTNMYIGGKLKKVLLHRFLLGFPDGVVDHINGCTFDARRRNLRVCTHIENCRNHRKYRRRGGYSSKYVGVCLHQGRWATYICSEINRSVFVASFDTEIEAARAYDTKAYELFGEFAKLNFPLEKVSA